MAPIIKFVRIVNQLVPLRIHIDRELMIRLESLGVQPPELTQRQMKAMIQALEPDLMSYVSDQSRREKSESNEMDEINDYIEGGQRYERDGWTVIMKRSEEILGRSVLKETIVKFNEETNEEQEEDEKKPLHIRYRPMKSGEIIDIYVQKAAI